MVRQRTWLGNNGCAVVRLSVIIPALNEAANIGRAVESAVSAGAHETIVVDGGSADQTLALAGQLDCRVIHSPRGRALQQNAGAQAATGDVLLFLHADNWLGCTKIAAQIERALALPKRLHGALRQHIDAAGLAYRLLEKGNTARIRWMGLPYGDQAIFVRREAFEQVGGFPEVPLMEDVMLMQRLRRQAWPALVAGPVFVSPRRWQQNGIVRQTLRNWRLLARYSLGASPEQLAKEYQPFRM